MKANKVTPNLQKQIRQNIEYLYKSQTGLTSRLKPLLDGVHPILKSELLMEINQDFMTKVKMFKYLSYECKASLIRCLNMKIYLPKEYIVSKGDPGSEMFFITNGTLEVIVNQKESFVLRSGEFAGEASLITEANRTASIVSIDYSELAILTKEACFSLVTKYREFGASLTLFARIRFAQMLQNKPP